MIAQGKPSPPSLVHKTDVAKKIGKIITNRKTTQTQEARSVCCLRECVCVCVCVLCELTRGEF